MTIVNVLHSVLEALYMAFAMFWEILWPLILGFALSGVVQAVVSKREMSRLLPDDSPRSLAIACLLGAASSSCSYAAVALARARCPGARAATRVLTAPPRPRWRRVCAPPPRRWGGGVAPFF